MKIGPLFVEPPEDPASKSADRWSIGRMKDCEDEPSAGFQNSVRFFKNLFKALDIHEDEMAEGHVNGFSL